MNELRFEGVTFVKTECVKLSRDEFIKRHVDIFWLDKDKPTRKKMLSSAYDLMAPPTEKSKK